MAIRVQLSGFKELDAQLKRLRPATARTALQRAGTDAMEPMARLARQLAPELTGELRESIDVGVVAREDFGSIGGREYSAVLKAGGSQAEAVAALRDVRRTVKAQRGNYYADVFMGPVAGRLKEDVQKSFYQEFGTIAHPPHAYLRPAFDQDHPAMLERLKKEIWFEVLSALERSAARAARKG